MTLTRMNMKAIMTMRIWNSFSPSFSRTWDLGSTSKGRTQDSVPERECRSQQEQYMIFNFKCPGCQSRTIMEENIVRKSPRNDSILCFDIFLQI